MNKTVTVPASSAGQRLDLFCVRYIPGPSRAALQQAIKRGDITVNNKVVKPHYLMRAGDVVHAKLKEKTSLPAPPRALPHPPIIYEDKDIVVVNKPAGIAVHPGIANESGTIADWFLSRYPGSSGGLVHRLDKNTSGVLLLAKTATALNHLKQQFKKHRVKKEYLALVFGVPKAKEGRINQPLLRSKKNPTRRTVPPQSLSPEVLAQWGRPAITEWRLEQKFGDRLALLRVFPLTGRTHQIRVHLHFIGHPIVGDPLYTFKRTSLPVKVPTLTGQLLHAEKITVKLPGGGLTRHLGGRKTFTAPLPDNFEAVLKYLKPTPLSWLRP